MSQHKDYGDRPAALIIAGAFEVGERPIALEDIFTPALYGLEAAFAANTSGRYRNIGERVLRGNLQQGLIIPNMGTQPGMGPMNVKRSWEQIRSEAEADFHRKLPERPRNQGIVLVGHSLGGNIATWLAHKHPLLVDVVITIGTPHEGIVEKYDKEKTHLNPALKETTEWVRQQRQRLGKLAPEIYAIASPRDSIVPGDSAHPDMPGMEKHLLDAKGSPVHEEMMNHEHVIAYCGNVMDEIAKARAYDARRRADAAMVHMPDVAWQPHRLTA